MASWVAARPSAQPLALTARPVDLQGILDDPQFVPSGVSDPRSGLGGGGEVEGWISEDLLEPFTWRHMLSTPGKPNVFLRLSSTRMERPVPIGVLLADLASWPGDREQEAVSRLLRSHRA